MIGAMILAAGASTRMGSAKALLPFRAGTFLSAIVQSCQESGLEPIVVVLGHDGDKILREQKLEGCVVAWNRDMPAGPIASIKAGLAILNRTVEAVVIWHVDRPHVRATTVSALVAGFRSGFTIVVPTLDGRRGHPVLFGRAVFRELMDVPRGKGARAVVRADPARVLDVPTDDPAVLEDVNVPAEYRRLRDRE